MNVQEFDYSQKDGFAWMIVDGKNSDESMTVQCCLQEGDYDPYNGGQQEYLMGIDAGDCGHNDGICGDVNKQAFGYWGENRCMTMLFKKAESAGIKVNY